MALILAWEQKDLESSQQPQEEECANEVDSPAPSPRTAAAVASHCGRTEGSQKPTPSTSTAEVAAAPSADTLPTIVPKLKCKNAMTRKSSKKYKSPSAPPDAAPTIVAITHVKDTPSPLKTRYASKKSSVVASDSESEATEEWQE